MQETPTLFPATGGDGPPRISPTDVSQFIRLEQCERYLRLRLHEHNVDRRFMPAYGVVPQRIPPLLTRSGRQFEEEVEQQIAAAHDSLRFSAGTLRGGQRPPDNERVTALARDLKPGQVFVLLQPRLEAVVGGWLMRGDADLLRLERDPAGELRVLIADMKASATAKVEHRLQVAFYHEMLAALFEAAGVACAGITLGILYRGPAENSCLLTLEQLAEQEDQRARASELLGARGSLLELVEDPESYLGAVRDLVTGPTSVAHRVGAAPFEDVPYHLAYKCDGCLYNEFCMKWSAQHDDLSLLPHLAASEKSALRARGIVATRELASLKEPAEDGVELVAAPGREEQARTLATTWPIGPRLDELVHRARRYRGYKGDEVAALTFIPSKGYGSLPYSAPDHNPNLVRVYIDAQHDYLHDRIYMLGALVVGCEKGEPHPARRRSVVHLADGPPDTPERERELFVRWIAEVTRAIGELAAPDEEGLRRAPVHLIFYDSLEQRLLLEALGRHLNTVLGATPLYDFVTQLAAYDSPVATFLDQEIKELKNYPMVCQSLQAVAAYLKFDWNQPEPYRKLFRARLFDFWGKLEAEEGAVPGEVPWYTNRSRFNSQIPLEYAYHAWGQLAPDGAQAREEQYRPYRTATADQLRGFHARRLEAMEWVARDFKGNQQTTKTPFDLSELGGTDGKARTLAHAIDEFVSIERHVALAEWKRARLAPPERRVLSGHSLLARYVEADQEGDTASRNRENERRRLLREEQYEAYRGENPDAPRVSLSKEERAESEWSQEGMRFRLRLDCSALACDLDEALRLSTLKEGESVVVCPRTAYDERLPPEERTPYTPTPKQMLYATRARIERIDARRGFVEMVMSSAFGGGDKRGFTFAAKGTRPLIPGELYTLDEDPNNPLGGWSAKVAEGLVAGEPNALYSRLSGEAPDRAHWPEAAAADQRRFLQGLVALHEARALHEFERSKHQYIGEHGDAPALLVQGPPGTGKSYTTGWAVFARIQGAMAAKLPYRALLSCKTHAATDVLIASVAGVQAELKRLKLAQPELFHRYFDPCLLEVPLYRVNPKGAAPDGTTPLLRKDALQKGEARAADRVSERDWCIVAATPGGVHRMLKDRYTKLFGHELFRCLVLDEASQMNLPEAAMAALPLASDGQLIVVGDHRQMPPIVRHDWAAEPRRTFGEYRSYESLFLTLLPLVPPGRVIKFEESFRLHSDMAEFLRREVYHKDGIEYHSEKRTTLRASRRPDPFVASVLRPEQTIVVVVHDEHNSQLENEFERELMRPVLEALSGPGPHPLDPVKGLGVVVPHRAQRSGFQDAVPSLVVRDPATGVVKVTAVDTVERFQGGERRAIVVSATESDREYLLASSQFLLDPRRLTVALSRAKEKMVLVASRSVFELFSADEETFANSQIWKNLLRRTCTHLLWEGDRDGNRVQVWGNTPTEGLAN